MLEQGIPGVILIGIRAPGIEGPQLLEGVRSLGADLPVILIAGEGDGPLALEAVRSGAYDFIEAPFSPAHLVAVVRRALEKRWLRAELEMLRRRLRRGCDIGKRLIGGSPQMEMTRRRILDIGVAAFECRKKKLLHRGELTDEAKLNVGGGQLIPEDVTATSQSAVDIVELQRNLGIEAGQIWRRGAGSGQR